jgi:hypothetical protein
MQWDDVNVIVVDPLHGADVRLHIDLQYQGDLGVVSVVML